MEPEEHGKMEIGIFGKYAAGEIVKTYGPELVNPLWCAVGLGWWDAIGGNFSGNGVRITSLLPVGWQVLIKNLFWKVGHCYLVDVDVSIGEGSLYGPYDGANIGYIYSVIEHVSYLYVPKATDNMIIGSNVYEGTIEILSIREVFESEE
jgi:hypothetical protein